MAQKKVDIGVRVRLFGFADESANKKYNNTEGTVVGFQDVSERWTVKCDLDGKIQAPSADHYERAYQQLGPGFRAKLHGLRSMPQLNETL